MKKSDDKPLPPRLIDSATFAELATKAMRRAQRVAEKENARYGMKLIVERPRVTSRKS